MQQQVLFILQIERYSKSKEHKIQELPPQFQVGIVTDSFKWSRSQYKTKSSGDGRRTDRQSAVSTKESVTFLTVHEMIQLEVFR